ncbi:MAG: Trk system potassium transporter TrkA [Lachnospiraceae bacterium]|nr:Trk system potassium transporter TrkA [Lachnospiraceae bacterium]MBR5765194.1 Trk system potassium transporter TrkA [Lachnospiraceae bacterium]MBR6469944.1 Trk system potassium transporter TrkA [Lachnospiraceae bacterium]MBR6485388.1 Trk system potassium transporter TrkA [Lachnospiraceae bacterium]
MFKQKKPVKQGLHIIIVGCGKVGSTLVEILSNEGNDITIIDKDPAIVESLTNTFDVMGIEGNGASFTTQEEAGIKKADLMIAVTNSDELNLLCCTVAKQVGNCATIARVRTPEYNKEVQYLTEQLGLAMIINPEYEVAKEISRILYLPSALEVSSFAHGQAELIKYKISEDNPLNGIKIADLSTVIKTKILICAIERDDKVYIPSGNNHIQAGDIISFVTPRKSVKDFFSQIGVKTNKIKDTMIIGGGKAAYYLANMLLNMGMAVKIIEANKARCEELSILLPKAIIINGDGTNEELLNEEGIDGVGSFIPLTGIDEENIILTLYAKQVSKAKVITKINRINFRGVISKLDLGSTVYPRYITSEAIIAYVRAKKNSMNSNIETLYHMFDHRVEAIEFNIDKESQVTGITLAQLQLKDNLIIAFINRSGKVFIPSGSDCMMVGDSVMIVTTHTGFDNILDILE